MIENDTIKEIELNILNKVVDYCEENKLRYFLTGGTLIGAVRHKGFIPWDDDIDINMFRSDYDFFFENFNNNRTDNLRAISIETNSDFYSANGKVYDNSIALIENINKPVEIGINIDIFPLDYLPDDEVLRKKLNKKVGRERNILKLKNIKISSERSFCKNAILFCSQILLMPIKREKIIKKITSLSKSYDEKDDCTYLAAISTLIWGEKEIFRKEDFEKTIKVEFEGRKYDAHSGFDRTLRQVYGDYMLLPPLEKRVSHHSYKVFEKKEEI